MPELNEPTWTKIKLSGDLKQYLKHKAVDNGHSLAQEICNRLERSRTEEEGASTTQVA